MTRIAALKKTLYSINISEANEESKALKAADDCASKFSMIYEKMYDMIQDGEVKKEDLKEIIKISNNAEKAAVKMLKKYKIKI